MDALLAIGSHLLSYSAAIETDYVIGRFNSFLAEVLMRVERGEIKRLIINVPPQIGKTRLAVDNFIAWYLGRNPGKNVILGSYAHAKACDSGRKIRNLMREPLHVAAFPQGHLAEDSFASDKFQVKRTGGGRRGGFLATGVGGPITGFSADLAIIDDPVKGRLESESPKIRKATKKWYTSDFYSRLSKTAAVLVIQTRWHEDDLTGYLLREHKHEGWVHLRLPAISKTDLCPIGRKKGEALFPYRYDVGAYERIKKTMPPRDWLSLYDQSPRAEGGNIIKGAWWKRYKEVPTGNGKLSISWDTASKAKEQNDPTAYQIWKEVDGYHYLLRSDAQRLEFPDLVKLFEFVAQEFPEATHLIEDKGSGTALIQWARKKHRWVRIKAMMPTVDKETRLRVITDYPEMGLVWLPEIENEWCAEFETELVGFPSAPHDDRVDAFSQYFAEVRKTSGSGRVAGGAGTTDRSKQKRMPRSVRTTVNLNSIM